MGNSSSSSSSSVSGANNSKLHRIPKHSTNIHYPNAHMGYNRINIRGNPSSNITNNANPPVLTNNYINSTNTNYPSNIISNQQYPNIASNQKYGVPINSMKSSPIYNPPPPAYDSIAPTVKNSVASTAANTRSNSKTNLNDILQNPNGEMAMNINNINTNPNINVVMQSNSNSPGEDRLSSATSSDSNIGNNANTFSSDSDSNSNGSTDSNDSNLLTKHTRTSYNNTEELNRNYRSNSVYTIQSSNNHYNTDSYSVPGSPTNRGQFSRSNSITTTNTNASTPTHSTPLRTRRLTARRAARSMSTSGTNSFNSSSRKSLDLSNLSDNTVNNLNNSTDLSFLSRTHSLNFNNFDPFINLLLRNRLAISAILNEMCAGTILLKYNHRVNEVISNSKSEDNPSGDNINSHYRHITVTRAPNFNDFTLNWSTVQSFKSSNYHGSIPISKIKACFKGWSLTENALDNSSDSGSNSSLTNSPSGSNCFTIMYTDPVTYTDEYLLFQAFNLMQCFEWVFYINFLRRFVLQQVSMNWGYFKQVQSDSQQNLNILQCLQKFYSYYIKNKDKKVLIHRKTHNINNNNTKEGTQYNNQEFTTKRILLEREIEFIREKNRKLLIDSYKELIEIQNEIDELKNENRDLLQNIINNSFNNEDNEENTNNGINNDDENNNNNNMDYEAPLVH